MGARVRRGYDRQGRSPGRGRRRPVQAGGAAARPGRRRPTGETGPVTETTPADDARAGLATPAGGQVPAPVGEGGPFTRLLLVRHGHARAVETGVVAGHK